LKLHPKPWSKCIILYLNNMLVTHFPYTCWVHYVTGCSLGVQAKYLTSSDAVLHHQNPDCTTRYYNILSKNPLSSRALWSALEPRSAWRHPVWSRTSNVCSGALRSTQEHSGASVVCSWDTS
jgi:hypothetical protein